jgi:hypothetical protein
MKKSELKQIIKEEVDKVLNNDIDTKLKSLIIVSPEHLKLKNSGGGEFPDSYTLTPQGIKLLKDIFNKNI